MGLNACTIGVYPLRVKGELGGSRMRVAVFVDFWNFQLSFNTALAKKQGLTEAKAMIEWRNVGPELAAAACDVMKAELAKLSYEGCYVYTSYNPTTDEGKKYRNWATTWLDRQPGLNVSIRERKPKAKPQCPTCHQVITHCPHKGCGQPIVATVEKGVDTLLVTDLIRLAFSNSYDAAVLLTSDADMVPAVTFVQGTGKKIIQAGFPPRGVDLATECWGSFSVMDIAGRLLRAA